MTAKVPGLCYRHHGTERDFYLIEILKLPINFYVAKCLQSSLPEVSGEKDLLGVRHSSITNNK